MVFVGYRDGFCMIECLRATSGVALHNKASPETNHHEPNRKTRKCYNRDFELAG